MPGFAEALQTPKGTGSGQPLLLDAHLDAMSDELRALALELLDSDRSNRAVADAFTDEGYPVRSEGAVRNYRKAYRLGIYKAPF